MLPPVPSAFRPGKTPGDLGGEVPACFNKVNGGNGFCHCQHVEVLMTRVTAIEARPSKAEPVDPLQSNDAWAESRRGREKEHGSQRPLSGDNDVEPEEPDLTTKLEPRHLGLLNTERLDKSLFDEKVSQQPECRFDGNKGGALWQENLS